MKVIWEASDFTRSDAKTSGMPVTSSGGEVYMVGWMQLESKSVSVLVSLRDGMVIRAGDDKEALAAYLTQRGFVPVFDHIDMEKLLKGRK